MTKERIEKELSKVRGQLADLQEKQKDLESQLQMAEDAEKMKFIEKNKISIIIVNFFVKPFLSNKVVNYQSLLQNYQT